MNKNEEGTNSWPHWLKRFFIGRARDPHDRSLLHNISLVAFFAWIGLGADGLSSSCYGPHEAWLTLQGHYYLGIFVALASAFTIFIISASYSHIVELFPNGGGGYLVASRLLSPAVGMVSGSALLIDYVLTITVSIASGADAVFSFLPPEWYAYKMLFAAAMLVILIILNLRGVKESVLILTPIFILFLVTHVFAILYSFGFHFMNLPEVAAATRSDFQVARSALGTFGIFLLLMRAYSMGAGTYTGIEAVSNGLTILREPKVKTAKKTMLYMSLSLAFMVVGIMFSYVFYRIEPVAGKTMNALLFYRMTENFGANLSYVIVTITLLTEAALLFVAAQTGFIGGPRILANMAFDQWVPKRFALLSDRLVAINGILVMGLSSLVLMIFSQGSVAFLVVLYSINVFLTFFLSQLGMVKHWWTERSHGQNWAGKLLVNGTGLLLTSFILVSVTVIKFHEGGWLTLLITGTLVLAAIAVKRNYVLTAKMEKRIDAYALATESPTSNYIPRLDQKEELNAQSKTAVILVKDFTGIGLETISQVLHSFNGVFKNFIFLQSGLINSGTLAEIKPVQEKIKCEVNRYVELMQAHGYHAEGLCLTGIDTVEDLVKAASMIIKSYPSAVFFGGQLVFPYNSAFNRWLHNYTLFATQRRFYNLGIPLFIVPIQLKK
ncbi:amino acid transporter [candidate division WOR-1 bacterium RIFCSPLOWO2_02_FULL_46_20]|uniref:Amino acid transporter n=1 Tax=candidate division WOR-1 bacterium RIFCSPLOWO2_02_FULL_46_20 TaxID=1802567 RepID=A0A1F4RCL3_UNCSA|nr:MAG: amino acid transporter [candidate division WOR-1 bacterium RIFCSPLOWO2_02_FULL_46_20]